MSLIKICTNDCFEVKYDKDRGMYQLSTFKDGHFQDEYWFDAYEEDEAGFFNRLLNKLNDYEDQQCDNETLDKRDRWLAMKVIKECKKIALSCWKECLTR